MKVYLTRRNRDMVEGKGPMIPDKCFLHKEHAEKYIDTQPGVKNYYNKWSKIKYGDWDILPLPVIEKDISQSKPKITNSIEKNEIDSYCNSKYIEYASETYLGKRLLFQIAIGQQKFLVSLGSKFLYEGHDFDKAKIAYETISNPEPPVKFEINEKVLVRNSLNAKWSKRYFAGYDTSNIEKPYKTYAYGATSWSTMDKNDNSYWKYCKKWKKDEDK